MSKMGVLRAKRPTAAPENPHLFPFACTDLGHLTESWKTRKLVKVTLELPSDLVREMKMQAVQEGRELEDVAEQIFRRGLAAPATSVTSTSRKRVKLPLIACRHAAVPEDELTPERVSKLLLDQEVKEVNAAARR